MLVRFTLLQDIVPHPPQSPWECFTVKAEGPHHSSASLVYAKDSMLVDSVYSLWEGRWLSRYGHLLCQHKELSSDPSTQVK